MEKERNQINKKDVEPNQSETKEPTFFQKNMFFLILLMLNIFPFWLHIDYTKSDMIVHGILAIISLVSIILNSIKKLKRETVLGIIMLMFFMFVLWDCQYNHENYKSYRQVDLEDSLDYFYQSEYYDGNIVKVSNFEKYTMVMTDQYIVTINNNGIQSTFEYDKNKQYEPIISTIEIYDYDLTDMDMNELQTWFYCYVEGENGIEFERIMIVGKKENNNTYPTSFKKTEYDIGQKDQEITKEYLEQFDLSINDDYCELIDSALIDQKGISGVVVTKPKEENEANGVNITIYDDQKPIMNVIGGLGSYEQVLDNTTVKVEGTTVFVGPLLCEDNDEQYYHQIIATYDQETQTYDFKTERLGD